MSSQPMVGNQQPMATCVQDENMMSPTFEKVDVDVITFVLAVALQRVDVPQNTLGGCDDIGNSSLHWHLQQQIQYSTVIVGGNPRH